MAYKINPNKLPSAARVKWEKAKRSLGTGIKGALGGAATGAAAGSVVPGVGTLLGALGGLALGSGAGTTQAIQQYNNRDVFGNPSNINADIQGVNPNATRHNESVNPSQLTPQARAEWEKQTSPAEKLKQFLVGQDPQSLRLDLLSPEQRELFNQQILPYILNQIGQSNQSLEQYGQEFAPFEQQARQDFHQNTIPSIAERFTALGSSLGGSSFRNQLANSAQNFESNLAGQKAQFALGNRANQQRNALGSIGFGLQPQFNSALSPATPGFLQGLAGGAGSLLSMAALKQFGL